MDSNVTMGGPITFNTTTTFAGTLNTNPNGSGTESGGAVTINAAVGKITLPTQVYTGFSTLSITLTNNYIQSTTSSIFVTMSSNIAYNPLLASLSAISVGTCEITVYNTSSSSTGSFTPIIQFLVFN